MPLSPDTVAVTAGRPAAAPDAPLSPPVVLSSTFHAGGPVGYARTSNPTWEALEEAIGALEGGSALAFASGMAAVGTLLELVPVGGVVVATTHTYSGVAARLADWEASGRCEVRLVPADNTHLIDEACDGASLLWLESPTNPALEVCDLAAACTAARGHGVPTVVDNTFATPILQRPLDLGADVVLHSATKSLSGHSDVIMGALVTRDLELRDRLQRTRTLVGGIPGPFEAWLVLRGIRTLGLRVRRATESAQVIAERLVEHPGVVRVRYPGLPGDSGHELAARQMSGFGSILSFETVGGAEDAQRVCESTSLIVHGTSLGGVETLIERRRRWADERPDIPETLVRVAVGIEDVEDLWADLESALSTLPA
jgi:cystathionine gamma-synthase